MIKETILANATNYDDTEYDKKYIVIHYTGNKSDTARNNATYFSREPNLKASAHKFVDERYCITSVPNKQRAYSVGKNYGENNLFGIVTNANSINIEMCSTNSEIKAATIANVINITKQLMKKYNIPAENVLRHFDVCSKQCPGWDGWIGDDDYIWQAFKGAISQ